MDKFNSINIKESAKAGNSFKEDCCTNLSFKQESDYENDKNINLEHNTASLGLLSTINASQTNGEEVSPSIFTTKTEETTKTLVESEPPTASNKVQENVELCDNVQQLKLSDQGPHKKSVQNQSSHKAPSTGVTKKIIVSESLSKLLDYGSSSEDSEAESIHSLSDLESDSDEVIQAGSPKRDMQNDNTIIKNEKYREQSKPNIDTDSSDSDESSDAESDIAAANLSTKSKVARTEGDLELDDLPPVPDLSQLNIAIKSEECVKMGNVTSIVDRLVMIQSLPNTPAYDLDTLLFLDEGKRPLGHVYDVMGQVTSPMYVVRFNSKQEIESKGVTKGLAVYSAPDSEHTQYVFLKQLMKIKGSDASWKGDSEVPTEFVDFSDDEAEYAFTKQNVNEQDMFDKKRKRNSLEKHKMYETAMNLRNKVDTARHKMKDTHEPTPKRYVPQNNHPPFYYHPTAMNQMRQQCSTSFSNFPPPNFVTPPPNFGFVNMGPPILNVPPYANQFTAAMPPFPPNPQPFPPAAYGPPAIPPLPSIPHVLPQPQPPPFTAPMPIMPPNMNVMNIPKQQINIPKSPKIPKMQQNTGVVPKAQLMNVHKARNQGLPKLYIPAPIEYQPPFPPNLGLPKTTVSPFPTNPPPNMAVSLPAPFGPPMPPWSYNIARAPLNARGFQPPHCAGMRPYKKH